MEEIDFAVEFINDQIKKDMPAMVHCAAGMGRAGTILCLFLCKIQKIYSKEMPSEKIRDERPGSIQSEVQELAIQYYEKYVRIIIYENSEVNFPSIIFIFRVLLFSKISV